MPFDRELGLFIPARRRRFRGVGIGAAVALGVLGLGLLSISLMNTVTADVPAQPNSTVSGSPAALPGSTGRGASTVPHG